MANLQAAFFALPVVGPICVVPTVVIVFADNELKDFGMVIPSADKYELALRQGFGVLPLRRDRL
ncbi:MAG TPA: hypothetical protein VK957_12210 [Lunatimonas sp.]|nr:hypothetical protein [Lunatimonas sp.]